MGEIKFHHWAHKAKDCDPWRESEGQWHLYWKNKFGLENTEYVMGDHRADVYLNGITVEVQHSSISDDTIKKRNEHYSKYSEKLFWILDFTEIVLEKYPKLKLTNPPRGDCLFENEVHFWWQRPRYEYFKSNVAIDIGGNGILVVIEQHPESELVDFENEYGTIFENEKKFIVGSGIVLKHDDFVSHIKNKNFKWTQEIFIVPRITRQEFEDEWK